jgi:hypothetical protein
MDAAPRTLRRSETVAVSLGDRSGSVRRPRLVGALVVKAAAHTLAVDPQRARHRSDFATLAGLL